MRPNRNLAGAIATILVALGGAAWPTARAADASASPSAAATSQPDNASGFAQLGTCLASSARLDVLFMLDMSGSNTQTDPTGARFDGLASSVAELGDLSAESDGRLSVNAAVAAFGNGYVPPARVADWRAISAQTAGAAGQVLRRASVRTWKALSVQDQATNYEAALSGARSSLLARGSNRSTCRAIFWFTDGLFDLGTSALTDAASARICAKGGVLDRIRADDISLVSLALVNPSVRQQMADAHHVNRRGELKAMSLGRSTEKTCGTTPLPESYRGGVYLNSGTAVELRALFSGALAQSRGGIAQQLAPRRPVRVRVDDGVRSFQVDMTARAVPHALRVSAPGGASMPLPSNGSRITLDNATVTSRRYGSFVTVQVHMPGNGIPGTWVIQPDVTLLSAQAYLFSGLDVRFDSGTQASRLSAGTPGVIAGTLVDSRGIAADLSRYAGVLGTAVQPSPTAADVRQTVEVSDGRDGRFFVHVTPGKTQTSMDIRVTFALRTSSGGALAPVSASQTFPVSLPAYFPSVEPIDALDLGRSVGTASVTRNLTLIGSPVGETRICIGAATAIQVPERAAGTAVSTQARCYALARLQRVTVPVTVRPRQSADGAASAALPLTLTGATASGQPRQTARRRLDVIWTMQRPVDQQRRAVMFAILTGASILVPLVLLWLINWLLARFQCGDNTRRAVVAVQLDSAGPRPIGDAALIERESLRFFAVRRGARIIPMTDAGLTLKASAPWNPLGSPSFQAVAGPGYRVVSNRRPYTQADGRRAGVTAGLGKTWLLSVTDAELLSARTADDTPITALLVIIVSSADVDIEALSIEVRMHGWESSLATLRRAALADVPTTPTPNGSVAPKAQFYHGQGSPPGIDDPLFAEMETDYLPPSPLHRTDWSARDEAARAHPRVSDPYDF